MTGLVLPTGFQAFQSLLAEAVASLEAGRAESVLMDIRQLPDWGDGEGHHPRSLRDLQEVTPFSLVCWFNPSLGVSVCRALGLDPNQAFNREVRAERLLPSQARPSTRRIELQGQGLMAQEIGAFMMTQGVELVSAVFHVASQRLYIGLPSLSHAEIAWNAARIEQSEYTRMTFSLVEGVVKASWMPADHGEAYAARRMIQRMFPDLFQGIPIRN